MSSATTSPLHSPLLPTAPPVPASRCGTQSSTPPPRRHRPVVRPGVAAANALVAREDGPAFRARAARVSAAWSGANRTATITAAEFRRHLLSYREGAQMEDLVEQVFAPAPNPTPCPAPLPRPHSPQEARYASRDVRDADASPSPPHPPVGVRSPPRRPIRVHGRGGLSPPTRRDPSPTEEAVVQPMVSPLRRHSARGRGRGGRGEASPGAPDAPAGVESEEGAASRSPRDRTARGAFRGAARGRHHD